MTTTESIICGCGKEVSTPRAMAMHQTSKVHKEWEASQSSEEGEQSPEAMDDTLVAALSSARAGDDPRAVAKMVRSVFNRMDWPDDGHPGTVLDWLTQHNIPTLTPSPHTEPDEARQNLDRQLRQFKSDGYGTERWEIKE
jgi:hypothetical protein